MEGPGQRRQCRLRRRRSDRHPSRAPAPAPRGRTAPALGVRKARHQLSQGTRAGTARPRGGCRAGL